MATSIFNKPLCAACAALFSLGLALCPATYALQLEEAEPYSDLGYQLAHGVGGTPGLHTELGVRFLDGNITNPSAGSTTYDRTVGSFVRGSYTGVFGTVAVNALLSATGYRRLISGTGASASVTEAMFYETNLQVLSSMALAGDVAFVGGISYDMLPGYRSQTESDNDPKFTRIEYSGQGLMSYRAGLIKNGGNLQAGILLGSHTKGTRTLKAVGGSSEADRELSQVHHKPQTLTFVFMRGSGSNRLRLELAAINGNRGNQNTEQGYTASDFFSVIRLGKGFGIGAFPLDVTLVYKTFGYKDSSRVTADTISAGALHFASQVPTPLGVVAVNAYGSLGKEGQSLAEINRQFDVVGFGATVGLNLGF